MRAAGRRTVVLSALVLAALIATAACLRTDPPPAASIAPSAARDSLRPAARWHDALLAARARVRALDARHDAPRWQRDDARRDAATLARIAAAPDSVRRELAAVEDAGARADWLEARGDHAGAVAELEAQLAARRRHLGSAHPWVARSLAALALRAFEHGDLSAAHALDEQALGIRRRALGERHPETAASLDRLGLDLKAAGVEREESMRLYRRALELRRQLLGADAPETIESMAHVANLHRLMSRPDSALAIFHDVLGAQERRGDRAGAAGTRFDMAMTLAPAGRYAEAESLLRAAVDAQRTLGPPHRAELARSLGSRGLALRHLGRLAEAETVLVEAGELFESLRRAWPHAAARPGWFSLVSHLDLAAVRVLAGRGDEAWVSLERASGRIVLEDLVRRGAIDTTGWWDGALARVQRGLPADAAVIGWLARRPGAAAEEYPFWGYVVRDRGPVRWVRVDRPAGAAMRAADLAVDHARLEIRRAAEWPLRTTDTRATETLGRAAWRQRFAPLEPWLDGVRRLVVVAPDVVHGMPLEAMADDRGRWLADRFAITYAPSALLDAHARAGASAPPASWRALIVGQPSGGAPAPAALPAAASEVRTLASRVPEAVMLTGADASRERLEALASSGELARYQLLHFATHAAVDYVWFGRSALVLAGETGHDGAEAQRLPAADIASHWTLGAELVSLAACGSFGGPASSTDGFLGLHQALLGAGARRVVASLWPVDDDATARLMGRFYEHVFDPRFGVGLAPADRDAQALAEARRWLRDLRDAGGRRPYAHPAYWSGLVLFSGGGFAPRSPRRT